MLYIKTIAEREPVKDFQLTIKGRGGGLNGGNSVERIEVKHSSEGTAGRGGWKRPSGGRTSAVVVWRMPKMIVILFKEEKKRRGRFAEGKKTHRSWWLIKGTDSLGGGFCSVNWGTGCY